MSRAAASLAPDRREAESRLEEEEAAASSPERSIREPAEPAHSAGPLPGALLPGALSQAVP